MVVANPPYVPAAGQDPVRHRMARCWDGGHDGRLLLDRLCAGLPDVAELPFGPVTRARAALLEGRGMIAPGQRTEEIVVVAGVRR